jgi:hypothetical protein
LNPPAARAKLDPRRVKKLYRGQDEGFKPEVRVFRVGQWLNFFKIMMAFTAVRFKQPKKEKACISILEVV